MNGGKIRVFHIAVENGVERVQRGNRRLRAPRRDPSGLRASARPPPLKGEAFCARCARRKQSIKQATKKQLPAQGQLLFSTLLFKTRSYRSRNRHRRGCARWSWVPSAWLRGRAGHPQTRGRARWSAGRRSGNHHGCRGGEHRSNLSFLIINFPADN